MTDRTLVCWNGTDAAEAALGWALRRSRDAGSRLELVDVVDATLFVGDHVALERAIEEEQDRLMARVELLEQTHPAALARHELIVGDPLEMLSLQTVPDTLVVVGTRRRTGPLIRYGWSIGARLATSASGPVAIVPADTAAENGGAGTGVVAGVDGSEISRLALAFAADEAASLELPLTIVHCWQAPLAGEPLVVPDDEFVGSQETAHRELLDEHVRFTRERHPGLAIASSLLRRDPIAGLTAASDGAFMVVVGSRRLTGWKRAWLGSVSHGLALGIPAPTVIVGPETAARP